MSQYTIRRVDGSDRRTLDQIMRLFDQQLGLGTGPGTRAQMLQDLADPAFAAFAAHSVPPGTVLGAASVRLLTAEGYRRLAATLPPDTLPAWDDSGRPGLLDLIAVDPAHRGHRVGKRLLDSLLGWLRGQGCRDVYVLHWPSFPGASSKPLLLSAGFTVVRSLPGYWSSDPMDAGSRCLRCGRPCHCTADLLHLPLTPSSTGRTTIGSHEEVSESSP
ncbi:Ribosomal protein S18 acetylase RimI [Streptoalloteichus tenebrarius]|uniref:Ribosomal protein S18 acetylase RimI n=1 Tax=Streptoalloteichus tenebrarius (strain ATCC 17920 / DSM 40477 / JCM 4838 / CBS 697.72 / NBRC 16177 / NCIMB 11028 / NRRL B-12390 / A12253. 1 / ISP 5477) TaxID=1933 RepID=A0ABT1HW97_STRSD|nr:GNAT family N-acetyltransferase [Streptoalloteichus tenebrarius]MCP2259799.1 Ribosomal protein S18 acetylase RimI [Streptoalloteichus tenebrarius]BFE99255.1 hypothetical protein GCM10020241_09310 [Streptoalloteichus tenebrarius]